MNHLFKFVLILVFTSMFSLKLYSEEFNPENLPALLGTSNAGTEFYVTFHPCWEDPGPNNALKIYVSSTVATKVTLDIEGLGISRTQTTIPNEVIEFNLKPQEGQMYSKGSGSVATPPQPSQVWQKRAIKIHSEDPIVVYGVTRFRYTSDGFLALPVHLLGTDYQVASYADPTNNTSQFLPSYTSIIGVYDNTKVTFKLGGTNDSKALFPSDTLRFGQTREYSLNSGDVLLVAGIGANNDLTGSTINADKPVAVISGNFCTYVPTWNSACDFTIEQEIPQNYWGKEIVVPFIVERKNNPIIKIFAKEPETNIYREGNLIGTIQTAGGLAGTGFLEIRSDVNPKRTVLISGDKPINVVLYNPGMSEDQVESDPFQMQLFPLSLFYKEMMFNTPGIKGGFGFKKNYLCIIFTNDNPSIPNDLEWCQVTNGELNWQKVDSAVYIQSGNTYYGHSIIKLNSDGVYKARHSQPIMCYAYGFSEWDSYGFPAGAVLVDEASRADTTKPVIVMSNKTETDAFGSIDDSKSGLNSTTDVFSSNLGLVTLLKSYSENVEFVYDKFVSGKTATTNWSVKLVDQNLPGTALIFASDRNGNNRTIKVELEGKESFVYATVTNQLQNPTLRLKQQYSDSVSLTNSSSYKTYKITEVYFTSSSKSGFTLDNEIKDLVLNGKQSQKISFSFSSEIEGQYTDTLMVKYEDGQIKIGTILNANVIKVKYTFSDLNFGNIDILHTATGKVQLKNLSPFSIKFNNFKPYNSTVFKLVNVTFPILLKANESINLTIEFTPKEAKEYIGEIEFVTDADEDAILHLSGIGYEETSITSKSDENSIKITQTGKILNINSFSNIESIRIIDINGSTLKQLELNSSSINIDISDLPNAVYLIEVLINGNKTIHKISI